MFGLHFDSIWQFTFLVAVNFLLSWNRVNSQQILSSQDQGFLLHFRTIYDWETIIAAFEKQGTFEINYPGVLIRAIICPPTHRHCPPLNITFQPLSIQEAGGVCGLDMSPTYFQGVKARIFLLPQLPGKGNKPDAPEGPRGLIATTTGIVFDLAGGCVSCTTIKPEINDKLRVTANKISHSLPVVVQALHSHSTTYFHVINELIPRLYSTIDYVTTRFNTSSENLIFAIRSDYAVINSVNVMLHWGLSNTIKLGDRFTGSFVEMKMRSYIEATENLIVPFAFSRDWYLTLHTARSCISKQLLKYKQPAWVFKCKPEHLPEKYILVNTRQGDRQRTLLNATSMVAFLQKSFNLPIVIPDYSLGCNLQDNVRFFRRAVGYIASHGASFTNVNFMNRTGLVIQILPTKPHPFMGPAISYQIEVQSLGHKYFTVNTKSTGAPRWDMFYKDQALIEKFCNKVTGFIHPFLRVWHPKAFLNETCMSYRVKENMATLNYHGAQDLAKGLNLNPDIPEEIIPDTFETMPFPDVPQERDD